MPLSKKEMSKTQLYVQEVYIYFPATWDEAHDHQKAVIELVEQYYINHGFPITHLSHGVRPVLESKMADKGMTLAIVLLVAGLIVGGGIGYFAAPGGSGVYGQSSLTIKVTAVTESGSTVTLYSGDSSWTFNSNGYNFVPDHTYKLVIEGRSILSVTKLS